MMLAGPASGYPLTQSRKPHEAKALQPTIYEAQCRCRRNVEALVDALLERQAASGGQIFSFGGGVNRATQGPEVNYSPFCSLSE